jgi:hypothetical protein
MKKIFILSAMMLTAMVTLAKDIKTVVVTTNPEMHCESCEKKIKGNLRFEKVSKTSSPTSKLRLSPSSMMPIKLISRILSKVSKR